MVEAGMNSMVSAGIHFQDNESVLLNVKLLHLVEMVVGARLPEMNHRPRRNHFGTLAEKIRTHPPKPVGPMHRLRRMYLQEGEVHRPTQEIVRIEIDKIKAAMAIGIEKDEKDRTMPNAQIGIAKGVDQKEKPPLRKKKRKKDGLDFNTNDLTVFNFSQLQQTYF
jgi:hypothetical protein